MIWSFILGFAIGHVITFFSIIIGAALNERKERSNAEKKE